jgi:FkbM family methyltransferase
MYAFVKRCQRWAYRARVRAELQRGHVPARAGTERLWGYDIQLAFPDRLVWRNQFIEIFGEDCYGVSSLPVRPRIIDGGANLGAFTLFALWKRAGALISAVEPSPDNLRYLKQNTRHVSEANLRVIQAAIWDRTGTVGLSEAASDAHHVVEGVQGVPCLTLASLIDGPVDLLKLDIEGAECRALMGAGSQLRQVQRVVMECHYYRGRPADLSRMIGLLEDAGFDRFVLGGGRHMKAEAPDVPSYCCLMTAWRSA